MKKLISTSLRVLLTIALLIFVVNQAGLFTETGQRDLVNLIKNASLTILLLAVIFGLLVNLVSSFKWYCLVRSQGIDAGFWRIFVYYVIGQFYNMFLPTSVGGDIVRAYELGKYSSRKADALASVFVERYTGILILLLVAGLAILSQLGRFNSNLILFSLIFFTIGLSFIAWLVIDPRPYDLLRSKCLGLSAISDKIILKLDSFVRAVHDYSEQPSALIVALLNSVLFYFMAVLNVFVTALVFNLEVSFIDVLIATPIIMLIMNIPFSIGNIGLMEFAYVSIFQIMGYSPQLGLSIALLMRLKSFFDAAIGGVLHPIFVTKSHE